MQSKLSYDMRQYFNQFSVEKLKKLNRSYGPSFEKLEEKIDACTQTLDAERNRLNELQRNHEVTNEMVLQSEEQFKINLEVLNEMTDQAERFLQRKSLSMSPMNSYHYELSQIDAQISQSTKAIEQLSNELNVLTKQKQDDIFALKILNSVIQQKEEELINTAQMSQGKR